MARITAAFGSSHSLMLVATREDWAENFRLSDRRMPLFGRGGETLSYDELLTAADQEAHDRVTPAKMHAAFERTHDSIAKLRREIEAAPLDALIIFGDDQHELFQDRLMPSLAIYYGDSIRNAAVPAVLPEDWCKRAQTRRREPSGDVHYPVQAALARHLITGLTAREFDVTALAGLKDGEHEGHAYSYIHRTYLQERKTLPVIPVFLNTYYEPNAITPKRCVQLGLAMKELIDAFPEDLRVGLIASGGLSHFVVDEELDHGVMAALKKKDIGALAALKPERLKAGSSEIRSWIAVAAAAQHLDLEWIDYIPAYRTPALTGTGLAFGVWK
jgi:3-O-methylgallate 3,4-dioxygenase